MNTTTNNTARAITNIEVAEDARKIIIETMLRNVATVGGVKFAEIPLAFLEIHPTVQRSRKGHERKIAAEWNRDKAGAIDVSYRDGHLYIIDGQHRFLAAQMVGEQSIACHVYENMDEQREAMIFATQGENTNKVSTKDKLRAMLLAPNDPKAQTAVMLSRICSEYNITLIGNDDSQKPVLSGIVSAQMTLRMHGEPCLRWIFDTIEKANWRTVDKAYSKAMIVALRNIYGNHKNDLRRVQKIIVKAIGRATFDLLAAKAGITYIGRSKSSAVTALLESAIENNTPSDDRSLSAN